MKQIIKTPNPILIQPTAEVQFDILTKKVVKDMKKILATAENPKGVGLAAPQIGVSLRIFLMRPEETDPISVFINPTYIDKSKSTVKGIPGSENRLEGCLSIPGVWGIVVRHESVKIKFTSETGDLKEAKFQGFASIIIQHEMDHLDGILFTRRVVEQKSQLYKAALDDEGKEVLEPLVL